MMLRSSRRWKNLPGELFRLFKTGGFRAISGIRVFIRIVGRGVYNISASIFRVLLAIANVYF